MQSLDGKKTMENRAMNEYFTKDIGEAAALLCKGAKLLRLQREGHFFWFVFSDKDSCQSLSNEYWFDQLLVNAKTYQDSLRTLKDRLFAQKQ